MGMWKAIKDKYAHGVAEARNSKRVPVEAQAQAQAQAQVGVGVGVAVDKARVSLPAAEDLPAAQRGRSSGKLTATRVMYVLNSKLRGGEAPSSAPTRVQDNAVKVDAGSKVGLGNREDVSPAVIAGSRVSSGKPLYRDEERQSIKSSYDMVAGTPRRRASQREEGRKVAEGQQPHGGDEIPSTSNASVPHYMRFKSAPDDLKEQRLSDHVLREPYRDVHEFYEIKGELGSGISAVVYRCIEKSSGQTFACKSIEKSKVLSVKDLDAIKNEVETMREVCDHAGVVALRDVFEDSQVNPISLLPSFLDQTKGS